MRRIKNRKHKINFESGIALVEVIAALGVAVVVITALVSLSISTLRSSLNSKLLQKGSDVANREIELVRAYRDSVSWADFITQMEDCGVNCYVRSSDMSIVVGECSQQNVSDDSCSDTSLEAATRSFKATDPINGSVNGDTDIVRIAVSVTWKVGGQDKGTYIYTDLTNWRGE